MSKELNVYHHELRHNEYAEFCLKYEVDKVIAEKDKEVARLKAKVDMQGKCGDLLRQKYLRCVARADLCDMSCRELLARSVMHVRQTWTRHDEWRYFTNYWGRNERRWRYLAERLKERL